MIWPFRKKKHSHPTFPVGDYRLDSTISGLKGLTEFTSKEYELIPREFATAQNFNAPTVHFLNREWKLCLGVIDGRLYKIAPYIEFKDKTEANAVAMETLAYCMKELGKPAKRQKRFSIGIPPMETLCFRQENLR